MFIIIEDWDENFHPTRINQKNTEEEAISLVDKLVNDMPKGKEAPNAFYAPMPGNGDVKYMIVDPVLKSVTYDTLSELAEIELNNWKSQMRDTDKEMSQEMFWHIIDKHVGLTGNPVSQVKFDMKKSVHDSKPK